jgi:hypothetical protein
MENISPQHQSAIVKCCTIAQLACGEDRRDTALINASYWPHSVTDCCIFKGSFDDCLAWAVPGIDAITRLTMAEASMF